MLLISPIQLYWYILQMNQLDSVLFWPRAVGLRKKSQERSMWIGWSELFDSLIGRLWDGGVLLVVELPEKVYFASCHRYVPFQRTTLFLTNRMATEIWLTLSCLLLWFSFVNEELPIMQISKFSNHHRNIVYDFLCFHKSIGCLEAIVFISNYLAFFHYLGEHVLVLK